jgi:hypothetical protein
LFCGLKGAQRGNAQAGEKSTALILRHSGYCLQIRSAHRSQRPAKGEVQPHPPDGFVVAFLQFRNAVVAEPGRAAPHSDIAMTQSELPDRIIALLAPELEGRGKT